MGAVAAVWRANWAWRLGAWAACCWAAGAWAAAPSDGAEILNLQPPLRFHISWRTPATVADGKYAPGGGYAPAQGTRWVKSDFGEPTPPPPGDWVATDFDDSAWPRRPGPILGGYGYSGHRDACLICVRARFVVTDPARATPLKLKVSYRGGAAVYLNGAEVARGQLPPGRLDPLTLAEDYAQDAFVGPDGSLLPPLDERKGTPLADLAEHYNKRIRTLVLAVPAAALRRGINVLAVEVHRAALPAALFADNPKGAWGLCGLLDLSLLGPPGAGVLPNLGPPPGVQIWNCDTHVRPGADAPFGDALEPLRPITLAAPRNGVCSGQIVVSAATELKGVSAAVSELKSQEGAGLNPDCLQVRYATVGQPFPMLLDKPPASAPLQPIWLTAHVPKDAAPGLYRGTLNLAGLARPTAVMVDLRVYDWTLPDVRDYGASVSLLHCPDSVAGYYKVPLWSEQHFKLLEKSLALLGYAGNTLFSIAAIGQDLFGDQPAIVFRKEGGSYVPDFRFARRYLEIYGKHAAPPRQLSVQVWNYSISRRGVGRDGGKTRFMTDTLKVLQLDGAKLSPVQIPVYSTPGTEKTWAAVASGVKQLVKELGWSNTRVLWGTGGDNLPNEEIVAFFKGIDPDIFWRVATHGSSVSKWGPTPEARTQSNGLVLGYANMVRRNITFRELVPDCPFDVIKRDGISPAAMDYLSVPPLGRIAARYSGIGFLPFDYWTYTTAEGTQRNPLACYIGFGNITPHCPRAFVMPGPDGAVATPQLEAFREGLQLTEAVLHLRAALADPQRAARIRPEFAAAAKSAIQELLDVMESNRRMHPSGAADVRRHIARVYLFVSQLAGAGGR